MIDGKKTPCNPESRLSVVGNKNEALPWQWAEEVQA
jgi:hypothetical protein